MDEFRGSWGASSSPLAHPADPFNKFSDLPPEIQRLIWEFHIGGPKFVDLRVRTQLPPPQASQVSREAREHVFQILGMPQAPISTDLFMNGPIPWPDHVYVNPRWVGSKDMLLIDRTTYWPSWGDATNLAIHPRVTWMNFGILIDETAVQHVLAGYPLWQRTFSRLLPAFPAIYLITVLEDHLWSTTELDKYINAAGLGELKAEFSGRLAGVRRPCMVAKSRRKGQQVLGPPTGLLQKMKISLEIWLKSTPQAQNGDELAEVHLAVACSTDLPRRIRERKAVLGYGGGSWREDL